MPTLLQASMSSVPAGAVTFLPSTVRFTSGIGNLVCEHWKLLDRSFFFVGAGSPFQMVLELFSKLLHERDRGHGRSIAEWTESSAQHVLGKVLHIVDIFL